MKPEPDHVADWMAPKNPAMTSARNREHGYRSGYIATRYGIVGLYDQVGEGDRPYTSLSFISDGREVRLSWNRTFSDRYLKTLANRFAAQHQGGGRG